MPLARPTSAVLVSIAWLVLGLAACSGDDSAGPATTPFVAGSPVEATSIETSPAVDEPVGTPTPTPTDVGTEPAIDVAATTAPVDEVGVPGLDSDEVVCRAWSRFAGSFQVVAVSAAFGDGGSSDVARLEVIAAPVVVGAYEELLEHWPVELADEAEAVSERFLGPYARRSQRGLDALVEGGASDADLAVLADVWLDSLAERDPASPTFVVVVPDELEPLVVDAAAAFDAQSPPVAADPSLVTDATVPATEAFLAANCPDGGALAGTEVGS